jgi:glycosyltransferase involved in cell wall biosynthesis
VSLSNIKVIIPAYNEEKSIDKVIAEIPYFVSEIVVANNNSSDNTAQIAKEAGATVIFAQEKGYGNACLKAFEYIDNQEIKPDILVFLDADYSDYPSQMTALIEKIQDGFDLVIGSRALGKKEKGSMTAPQIFGNWLATRLMKWFYGSTFTDLGPFRAIRYQSFVALKMCDKNYGWTVEMQLKSIHQKLKYTEVAVDYKNRIGVSKISGTLRGVIGAGYKIITLIFKYRK